MWKIKHKGLIFVLISLIPILIEYFNPEGKANLLFFITNFVIVFYSLVRVFEYIESANFFNTNTFFYIFNFFFLGVAPLYQYRQDINIWGGAPIPDDIFIYTNVICIFIFLCYDIFYYSFINKPTRTFKFINRYLISKIDSYDKKISFKLFILSFLAAAFMIYMNRDSLVLLFFREVRVEGVRLQTTTQIDSSVIKLFTSFLIRPIPLIALMYFKFSGVKNRLLEVILWVFALISNFPLALARFYFAGLYLPLVFIYLKKIVSKRYRVSLMIIFGLLFVFPFLNQGRTTTNIEEFTIGLNMDMFVEGHFDNYQNFARVLQYNTITYGKQLLGVLLFFVPRSIYPTKAIGSGGFIAEEYNLSFDHISMNFFGEGFLNFGIIGIILFAIILASLNSWFDKLANMTKYGKSAQFKVMYYIYISMMIFNIRGDLISSVAFTTGLILCSGLVFAIIKN